LAESVRVVFQPEGKTAFVLPGSVVLEAAARAGIVVETPCGGRGTCGKCRVVVRDGCSEPTEAERQLLSADELAAGQRLACQTRLLADTVVVVPESSRFGEQRILTEGEGGPRELAPAVRKRVLRPEAAALERPVADSDRVRAALADVDDLRLELAAARQLPLALGAGDGTVTAVVHDRDIIAFEPGDTAARLHGVAFDVGTTTVVASLLDLRTGHEVAVASRTNPQVAFGDDVVSRISHATEGGLAELQQAVVGCLNALLREIEERSGIPRDQIYEATVVGNTTMSHLLLGLEPEQLARIPFAPVVREGLTMPAAELGLEVHERGRLHVLPNIAGFVGSDTVGVILATGLLGRGEPTLAVDIGTNGEMVMALDGRLVACSTAAGPAFEGARIRHGMRAAPGAIEQVRLGEDVAISVVGNARPRGICGSALIDTVAELLRAGILDPSGRLLAPDELPAELPDGLRRRVVPGEGGYDFVVVGAEESATGEPIALTQRDIRQVQLAKGAIRAGIEILKKRLGLADSDLAAILLAGGFGNFIRRSNAVRIGLLPPVEHERIRFVGNAALAGAKMALASVEDRRLAEEVSRRVEYLELGSLGEFAAEFAEAMLFPEN